MNSKFKILLFFSLFAVTLCVAQTATSNFIDEKMPQSIYTSIKISNNFNSVLNLNKRLNLKSFNFILLDENSIEEGYFSVPICSISTPPTKYIYDTYNRIYHVQKLKQAFFKVSDLYKVRQKNPF